MGISTKENLAENSVAGITFGLFGFIERVQIGTLLQYSYECYYTRIWCFGIFGWPQLVFVIQIPRHNLKGDNWESKITKDKMNSRVSTPSKIGPAVTEFISILMSCTTSWHWSRQVLKCEITLMTDTMVTYDISKGFVSSFNSPCFSGFMQVPSGLLPWLTGFILWRLSNLF